VRPYLRQLRAGRDLARGDQFANSMANYAYAVGDLDAGQAVLVDPAHDPVGLVELVEADGLEVVGVVATHFHFDHVGGEFGGRRVAGLVELLEARDVAVHVQRAEVPWVARASGTGEDPLVAHDSGDVVRVGELDLTLVHTPGHTPGSQCVLVAGALLTGDTLFLHGCGRTDLPGADPSEMYRTLHQRLAALPDELVVLAGHDYDPAPSATLGEVRATNAVLAPLEEARWLEIFS
jgi:hydroxyacylglutathione hydrolase